MRRHVKLFEEWTQDGNHPDNSNGARTFIYYINNHDEKKFDADVRDPDGKVIFELKASDLQNDGLMKGMDDIAGLRQLLLNKNKIKPSDVVVAANASGKAAGGGTEDFVPEVNTNLNQHLLKTNNTSNEN